MRLEQIALQFTLTRFIIKTQFLGRFEKSRVGFELLMFYYV